jgi:hypothetical protein
MPQILDNLGQQALFPFKNQNITGESSMLKAMAATTKFSSPIIDTANEISPLGDQTMRFLQALDLGKNDQKT